MSMTTIEFKLPVEIYNQAKAIFEANGLTMEEACVLFIEETVKRGTIPFEYTQKDIEEVRRFAVVRNFRTTVFYYFTKEGIL